jgi:hypothetical protein
MKIEKEKEGKKIFNLKFSNPEMENEITFLKENLRLRIILQTSFFARFHMVEVE